MQLLKSNLRVFSLVLVSMTLSLSAAKAMGAQPAKSKGWTWLTGEAQPTCKDLLPTLGVPVHSFTNVKGRLTPAHAEILETLKETTASAHRFLSQELSERHAYNDNSFQVKDATTGSYGKTVAVPVSSYIAPIPASQFNRLVKSSEPLLRAFRSLLQRIYSGHPLTIEGLGLQGLPQKDAELVVDVIKNSIYLEPKLIAPSMQHYPFISVAGLDGAIGNPADMKPRFFEVNLGTPSGLSNNAQLEQEYLKIDPNFKGLLRYTDSDDTFDILRQTIESNAKAWTGVSGVSVIISPGEYNAAHPDVVAISRYTGMSIVRAQDLYEGSDRFIYWNVGPGKVHPRVTGIYGRREESYFLQNPEIPMISPEYANNEELGKKLGTQLRPGAIYKFIRNDQGEIVDIEGLPRAPQFDTVWDTVSLSPSGRATPTAFADAIVGRRLYYSAIGGRVVDDKRLFPIVAKYLTHAPPGVEVAQPVKSLPREQYDELYTHPEQFFVKEPSNSGGAGVYAMALESRESQERILEKVRANPEQFEVQYISELTTLPTLLEGRKNTIDHVPTDLRLFVTLDAAGHARAGRNSLLLRTARPGQLLTNTSRGGGYGIGLVFSDEKTRHGFTDGEWEAYKVKPTLLVSDGRMAELDQTFKDVTKWITNALGNKKDGAELRQDANDMVYRLRSVMDLMPKSMHSLISIVRNYSEGRYHGIELLRIELVNWNQRMGSDPVVTEFPVIEAKPVIDRFVTESGWRLQMFGIGTQLRSHEYFDFHDLDMPEPVYTFPDGSKKWELGRYEIKGHPFLQQVEADLKEFGGEIRLARVSHGPGSLSHWDPPYFWVNFTLNNLSSYLKPVIAIDLTEPMALPAIAHEHGHFLYWRKLYHQAIAQKMTHEQAMEWSAKAAFEDEHWILSEHEAVTAEMAMEKAVANDPLARTSHESRRAQMPVDWGYVNRVTYPEFAVVRNKLERRKTNPKTWTEQDEARTKELIAFLVDSALEGKQNALDLVEDLIKRKGDFEPLTEEEYSEWNKSRDLHRSMLKDAKDQWVFHKRSLVQIRSEWRGLSILQVLIWPYGREELKAQNIYEEFLSLLFDELAKRGLDEYGLPLKKSKAG